MKRRDFFNASTLALIGGMVRPFTAKAAEPKAKVCLIGVGTSGCNIAANIHSKLPYLVNYHGIDSTNNTNEHGHITCWYQTQITDRFLFDTDNLQELLEIDWAYNSNRRYFTSHLNYMCGDIFILANMGRKTGSFTACMLAKYLSTIPDNRVTVIATTPFKFDWSPTGYDLAAKCVAGIKESKVKITVFDFAETFKNQNITLTEAYSQMDEILIENISSKLS